MDYEMTIQQEKRPVIGILAQEASRLIKSEFNLANSYIAASYVKAVEASGARVLPIFLDKSDEYYREVIQSINGLLLPGGNTWFYEEDNKTPKNHGYVRAAELLYNEAKKINENGIDFPVLGICLGFEVLLFLDEGKRELRRECDLIQSPLPLDFCEDGYKNNFWTRHLDLFEKPVFYFSHQFYIAEETMKTNNLIDKWNIIATTTCKRINKENIKFVSIIESRKYPIIGLQFHPEKNSYEWKTKFSIPHNERAVTASRYIFDWFVQLCKNNNNYYEPKEDMCLINQFPKTKASDKMSFDEMYLFGHQNVPIFVLTKDCIICDKRN